MRFPLGSGLSAAVACLVIVACTPSGYQENPIARTIGWFSYVGGKDIRQSCDGGLGARYRFVYNAVYTEQVRTYDISLSDDDGSATLVSRVLKPYPAVQITLQDPLKSWEGVVERTSISHADIERLQDALLESGYHETAPMGLRLRSDNFYWIVTGCVDGGFHLNAFQAPAERFARITFPDVLFRLDSTGIPVNPLRSIVFGASEATLPVDRSAAKEVGFVLEVGPDGRLR